MDKKRVGVIIARFQVPDLHEGHKYLIKEILTRHTRVLVLLGCAPIKLSENDPLNFATRKAMVEEFYYSNDICDEFGDRDLEILPLYDKKTSDELWSAEVDKIIKENYFVNDQGAILYGSRDSFIPHYKGVFNTVQIESPFPNLKGTDLREDVAKHPMGSSDFRRGVIYATFDKFPFVYSCVDVAIMKGSSEILLGRKSTDPIDEYRFIGGFVDPTDPNDFAAARREAYEETGASVEPYNYICSTIVNDWRYIKEKNCKIMTRLIIAEYISGPIKAADDIEEVKWFDFEELYESNMVESHRPLLIELKKYINNNSI